MAVCVIELQTCFARCCLCGDWSESRWGVPVNSTTGLVISNESNEDWCGRPACESCHDRHAHGDFIGTWPGFGSD